MTPACPLPFVPRNWWRGKDSNLRRRKPADLQSAPVGRLGTPPGKIEPRILVTTPRSVNGIGATFAMPPVAAAVSPARRPLALFLYAFAGVKTAQPGPRLGGCDS